MPITNQQGKLILVNAGGDRIEFTVTNDILSTTGTNLDDPFPQIVTTGLLDYWWLDEGTTGSGDIKDMAFIAYGVGNNPGNDGTRFGTAPYTAVGIFQNAADFSGDDYITVPNNANMFNASEMSVDFWINIPAFPSTMRVMRFGTIGGGDGFEITIDSGTGVLTFSPTGVAGVATTGALPTSTWTNVAITFKNPGSVKVYIDGVLNNTNTATGNMTTPAGILIFGAANVGLNSPLIAKLDEIHFWNTELTAGNVLTNYNAY